MLVSNEPEFRMSDNLLPRLPLLPSGSLAELCQASVDIIEKQFGGKHVAIFLFSKKGCLTKQAASDRDWLEDESYEPDQAIISKVLGPDTDSPYGIVQLVPKKTPWDSTYYVRYKERYGDTAALFLPLDGPNRSFGFLRFLYSGESPEATLVPLALFVRHAAMSISNLRRRMEIEAAAEIRELTTSTRVPVESLYETTTNLLVIDWTEYAAASIRLVNSDNMLELKSLSCAPGVSRAGKDSRPRSKSEGFARAAFDSGKPIIVECISDHIDQFMDREWIVANRFKSFACFPIRKDNRAIGTLSLFSQFQITFFPTKINFLMAICEQVSNAIDISMSAAAQQRVRTFIEELILPNRSITEMLQSIVNTARELTQAQVGYIALASREDRFLHPIVVTGSIEPRYIPVIELDGLGLTAEVFRGGVSINCPNVSSAACGDKFVDLLDDWKGKIKSELVVRMVYEGKPIGVINMESTEPDHFSSGDQNILEVLAHQATLFYQKQKFYEAATRLANARFLPTDKNKIYNQIVEAAEDISGTRAVCLWIFEKDKKALRLSSFSRKGQLDLGEMKLSSGSGPVWRSIKNKQPALVALADDSVDFPYQEEFYRLGFEEMISVPLLVGDDQDEEDSVVGALTIFSRRAGTFVSAEYSLLRALSIGASFAIKDNQLLAKIAYSYEKAEENANLVSIGEIAVGVAHDTRGLLNQINTAFLAAKRKISKEVRLGKEESLSVELDKVEQGLETLTSYFDRLRHYARFSTPSFANEDITDIIKDVIFLLGHRIEKNSIRVRTELKSLPLIKCDREQVARVFMNIITNALDAMKPRGNLFIGTELYGDDRFVRIRIIDDGASFDEQLISQVFEPYFTTKKHGTGFGLPVARQIIHDVHGGRVDIVPKRGKGTTVYVLLPNERIKER
jgi:signal transduction histidine kinase/putative methionine-R-sulfoxide reductase with GAF domain